MIKQILIVLLCGVSICRANSAIDYERLSQAIYLHEGGANTKYLYGCEGFRHGQIHGWPKQIAKQICIRICRRVFNHWQIIDKSNNLDNYFKLLNKVYSVSPDWYMDVEKLYYSKRLQNNG